jgi:hypothetical protein
MSHQYPDPRYYGSSNEERLLLIILLIACWPAVVLAYGIRRLLRSERLGQYRKRIAAGIFVSSPVFLPFLFFFGDPLGTMQQCFTALFMALLGHVALSVLLWRVGLFWLETGAFFPLVALVLEIVWPQKAEQHVVRQALARNRTLAIRSQRAADYLQKHVAPDEVRDLAVLGRVIDMEE